MLTETTTHHATEPTRTTVDRVRAVLVAFGLLAAAAIAIPLVTEGFRLLQIAFGLGESFLLTFAVGGTLATLSLGVIALVFLRVRPVAIPVRRPTRREWGWIAGGVVLFVAQIAIAVAAASLGIEEATNGMTRAAADNPVLVYSLGIVSVLALIGPIEELLYRGVVQGRLRETFGPVGAIGFTAVGFAAAHVATYIWGGTDPFSAGLAVSLVNVILSAIVFGVIYEQTRNLAVVVLAHGLFNAFLLSLALLLAL